MKELVEVIAKSLVDHPEDVEVIETSKDDAHITTRNHNTIGHPDNLINVIYTLHILDLRNNID